MTENCKLMREPLTGVDAVNHTLEVHRFGLALAAAVACVALTTQALPAAGASPRNLVVNGGFERFKETKPRHWSTRGAANVFYDRAHTGTAHMDLVVGAPLPNVASVRQALSIPASISRATLTFWTEDWSCGTNIHFDDHVIAGGHDTIVNTIPGAACGTGYVKTSVSLGQFKGQNVKLRLSTTWAAGGGGSLFYLDDVALRVS